MSLFKDFKHTCMYNYRSRDMGICTRALSNCKVTLSRTVERNYCSRTPLLLRVRVGRAPVSEIAPQFIAKLSGWVHAQTQTPARTPSPELRVARLDLGPAPFARPHHKSQFERKLHEAEMNLPWSLQFFLSSRQKT
ncbi:hypothetical protein R6Z07F_003181 [Ovis aries]